MTDPKSRFFLVQAIILISLFCRVFSRFYLIASLFAVSFKWLHSVSVIEVVSTDKRGFYGILDKYGLLAGVAIMHGASHVALPLATIQLFIMLPTTLLLMSFV